MENKNNYDIQLGEYLIDFFKNENVQIISDFCCNVGNYVSLFQKNNINAIFETITNYNQDISSWYDEDFKTDISKLLNSITTSNEKYKSFKQSDFILI